MNVSGVKISASRLFNDNRFPIVFNVKSTAIIHIPMVIITGGILNLRIRTFKSTIRRNSMFVLTEILSNRYISVKLLIRPPQMML